MTMIIDGTNGLTFNDSSTQASAGKVLQVVNSAFTGLVSNATTTFTDTGLTATITPKFSTSKILVLVSVSGCYKTDGNSVSALQLRLVRNSTTILRIDGVLNYTGTALSVSTESSTNYLDSPATTSATTYKIQFANGTNAAAVYINNYYSSPAEANSTITLLEIAQ